MTDTRARLGAAAANHPPYPPEDFCAGAGSPLLDPYHGHDAGIGGWCPKCGQPQGIPDARSFPLGKVAVPTDDPPLTPTHLRPGVR